MKKKLNVTTSEIVNNECILKPSENAEGLIPKGQMLVDSDNLSFVYLMEHQDEYIYILLPEVVWSDLKKCLDNHLPVHLETENGRIELTGFHEELGYLAENIKGNGNYGEDMVAKVEIIF
ncbi:hypothetical protein D1B31_00710 [Neobacillus notoginsengisoli]|uniref:Uncharacterized protein n=1 Tax=Neobacillus notoginsengisoli TaxID=1578198 RepID=A0A417YZD3_9BACI|nr:hypothetical protein [Neobacillus notoginsengisoli]RHW43232.1 hypothetical protein D1B31_00710 [Neobacillus notoginsengisoli]